MLKEQTAEPTNIVMDSAQGSIEHHEADANTVAAAVAAMEAAAALAPPDATAPVKQAPIKPNGKSPAQKGATPPAKPVAAAPAADAAVETDAPVPPVESEVEKRVAPQLALLARRDREQRAAHEERVRGLAAKESALADREKALASFEDAKRRAASDPVGLFKSLGIESNLGSVAQLLYYAELGKDAPAEFQSKVAQIRLQQEIETLRRESEADRAARGEAEKQVELTRLVESYRGQVRAHLGAAAKDAPRVAKMFKAAPDRAVDALIDIAAEHARKNPEELLPPSELARRLEDALAEEYRQLGLEDGPVEPEQAEDVADTESAIVETQAPTGKTAPQTLTNRQTQAPPPRRAGQLTEKERVERAIAKWTEADLRPT
jgi:hypothetical protein